MYKSRSLKILGLFFIAVSCKFNVSPYTTDAPKLSLNDLNVRTIKSLEAETPTSFKVAFISDTHNYYKELEKQIDVINSSSYAFAIVAGDITNLGLIDEFHEARSYLNGLKIPYLVAVGNHDLISGGRKIYKRLFGSDTFHFIFHDTHFIIFNNNNWESPGRVPDMDWVEAVLSQSDPSHKRVLIAHVSPEDTDRFTPEEISRWEDLMVRYNVDYFLNGHDHNPYEKSFGNGVRITIGASSKKSFYELSITSGAGGISHQKISF